MQASDNLLRVARALSRIPEQRFVFAGASILPLLIDDPAAPPIRPTIDVDAVVDVVSYGRWERLQSRLHDCGLTVRADMAVGKSRICLFHLDEIEVDIMPANLPAVLSPPSRMLELGFASAEVVQIAGDLEIETLTAPALLAAKLEAFRDRGLRSLPVSKDLEDIVALLDGRINLEAETRFAPAEMRHFIALQMRSLMRNGLARDVISDILRDSFRENRTVGLMEGFSKV